MEQSPSFGSTSPFGAAHFGQMLKLLSIAHVALWVVLIGATFIRDETVFDVEVSSILAAFLPIFALLHLTIRLTVNSYTNTRLPLSRRVLRLLLFQSRAMHLVVCFYLSSSTLWGSLPKALEIGLLVRVAAIWGLVNAVIQMFQTSYSNKITEQAGLTLPG